MYDSAEVGENGVVTFSAMSEESYTISVNGFRNTTFSTVGRETTLEKSLAYEMFEDSTQTDAYIAGNGSFTPTARAVFKGIDSRKDIVYAEMTIKAATAKTTFGTASDCGGAFFEAKGQHKTKDNVVTNDKDFTWGTLQKTVATNANNAATATWSIRWGMAQWSDAPCTSTRFDEWGLRQRYATVGIKIAVLIRNGYMWVMCEDANANLIVVDAWDGSANNNGDGVEFIRSIHSNQPTVISNIKVSRTYSALSTLGHKVFDDETEFKGFNQGTNITVTDNGNSNYDFVGKAGAKESVSSKVLDSSFVASSDKLGNKIGANTYNFDEGSEFVVTFKMALNNSQGSAGYWTRVRLRNAWWLQGIELTSWNNYVDLKYNANKIKTIYKNDGTALHGLTALEVGGVTYITFTCVWKSDVYGYSAIYEADGTTLIYSCANETTAKKKCRITGSDLVIDAEGSADTNILDWSINISVKV